ncbi:MAG TPA: hypothetical protein VM492_10285 [Sumerlaeia bacterium]|nr:hypothetical protein [Sumerlaeia bacterium]
MNEREILNQLREDLADYAHHAWTGWMLYLFSKCVKNPDYTMTIPAWAAERWHRQATTGYPDLPEEEKGSDREEAERMLAIFESHSQKLRQWLSTQAAVGAVLEAVEGVK